MNALLILIPVALFLGGLGLAAFLWSLKSGQFEDLDGAAQRILLDDDLNGADDAWPHGKAIDVQKEILPNGEMSDRLKAFLEKASEERSAYLSTVDFSRPPWVAHPEIPAFSIGWRMGYGEDYMGGFHKWLKSQTDDERQAFFASHPEPESWRGFYGVVCERLELKAPA